MEEIEQFLQLADGNPWIRLIIGSVLLVFSVISLIVAVKKNKVLSDSQLSTQVDSIFKAMSVIIPAVTVLLDQKGKNNNENESLKESGSPSENEKL